MLHIEWGNDLRELARRMFKRLDGEGKAGAEELFSRRDLIAAANRVQLGWLKLEAMCRNESKRVWALRKEMGGGNAWGRVPGFAGPGGGGCGKVGMAAGWRKLLSREFDRGFDEKGDERGADAVRQAPARLEELAEEQGSFDTAAATKTAHHTGWRAKLDRSL